MASGRTRRIGVARILLLALFLMVLATVVWFLRDSRQEEEAARRAYAATENEPADVVSAPGADSEITVSGRGYRQVVTQEERVLFEIEGDEYQVDRYDQVKLGNPRVRIEREEGTFVLTGERATFRQQQQTADVEGSVELAGPSGLRVWADRISLVRNGEIVQASKNSRFALGPELRGTSEDLHLNFVTDELYFGHGVELRREGPEGPPLQMTTEFLVVERALRRMRAQGGVALRSGDSWLRCARLFAYFWPRRDRIQRLQALWRVEGSIALSGDHAGDEGGGRLKLTGVEVQIAYDPFSEPRELVVRGPAREPARMAVERPGQPALELRGDWVSTDLESGIPLRTRAGGRVQLSELRAGDAPRLATGQHLNALYDPLGELERVDLFGDVVLEQQDLEARSDRAEVSVAQRRTRLVAGEGKQVVLTSSDGRLQAPLITLHEQNGLIEAEGGVRTELARGAGVLAGPLSADDSEEPVRVTSDEAILREDGEEMIFRGGVRAWQGRSLLVSDQLRGRQKEDRVAAAGAVRTVWFSSEPAAGSEVPIEASADAMDYDRGTRRVRYEGSAMARKGDHRISCDSMEIELDADDQAEILYCDGNTLIEDDLASRRILGERATYWLTEERVEVNGSPVQLRDPAIGEVSGRTVHYSFETGIFQIGAGATAQGEPAP